VSTGGGQVTSETERCPGSNANALAPTALDCIATALWREIDSPNAWHLARVALSALGFGGFYVVREGQAIVDGIEVGRQQGGAGEG
jgi:hypothetical protein